MNEPSGRTIVVDLGSSNLKLTLFGEEGNVLRTLRRPTPLLRRKTTFVEIEPEELLRVVQELFEEMARLAPGKVSAVTATGMAKSELPLDEAGKPLYPCITWMDRRCGEMRRDCSPIADRLQHYPIVPNALPFKLAWMRHEEPDVYRESHKWVNLLDYLHAQLAGGIKPVTDYTEASRSMIYDSLEERWNGPVAEFFGVDLDKMPAVKPAGTVLGSLHPRFGLGNETAVVLGGHDHMCAAKAACMVGEADAPLLSTGTSEVLAFPFVRKGAFQLPRCNLDHQTAPGRLALGGCVARSGETMRWADDLFGLYEHEKKTHLTEALSKRAPDVPLFVPPFRYSDAARRGGFSNLNNTTDRETLSLSVLEGLAHATRALFDDMAPGKTYKEIKLVGGFSRMEQALALKAAALTSRIVAYPALDMASLGGFLLCVQALAPGVDIDAFSRNTLSRRESYVIAPDAGLQELLNARYGAYRVLARQLEETKAFREI